MKRKGMLALSAALMASGLGVWLFFWVRRGLLFWGAGAGWALGGGLTGAALALAAAFLRPIPIKIRTVSVMYLLLFGLLSEGILSLAGFGEVRRSGVLPVVLTIIALIYAYLHGKKTIIKRYSLETEQPLPGGSLRVGLLSDVHMGLSVDGARLRKAMRMLAEARPELLIVAGDLVDDQTSFEEMRSACAALGEITTKYGVYFVYGNHDTASHGPPLAFTRAEFEAALRENGVHILADERVELPGPLTLAGRRDAGITGGEPRIALRELLSGARGPVIVVDHQPDSAPESAEAGALLHLSGHTHGGQLWPANLLLPLINRRAPQYGCRLLGKTWAVTSCGLGTRGSALRSGSTSEAVLLQLRAKLPLNVENHVMVQNDR